MRTHEVHANFIFSGKRYLQVYKRTLNHPWNTNSLRKKPFKKKELVKTRPSSRQVRIETGRNEKKPSHWKDMSFL